MTSRQDGAQDALLVVAHEDKFAVVIGLLDEFQQFVSGLLLELLGEPQDEHLVLGGIGTERHLAHDTIGLTHKDLRLCVIILEQREPRLIILDRMLGDKLTPLVDVITRVTGAIAVALAVGVRITEVGIHLVERLMLAAHRAHAAGVAIDMVLAVQVLSRSHRQGQLGHSGLAIEQQRMRQPVGVNHPPDLPDSLLIA